MCRMIVTVAIRKTTNDKYFGIPQKKRKNTCIIEKRNILLIYQSDKNLLQFILRFPKNFNQLNRTQFMKQYYTIVLASLIAISSNAQSLVPGQITNQTSNRAILAQRFTALNANKEAGSHGVYIGIPDLDITKNRRAVDFSYQKTINFTISYSAANNTFSNVTEMADDSTKRVSRNITIHALSRFLGDSKASKLGFMNFMQVQLNIGNSNTSVAISDLKLN